jgi:hypothetical protein
MLNQHTHSLYFGKKEKNLNFATQPCFSTHVLSLTGQGKRAWVSFFYQHSVPNGTRETRRIQFSYQCNEPDGIRTLFAMIYGKRSLVRGRMLADGKMSNNRILSRRDKILVENRTYPTYYRPVRDGMFIKNL